MSLLNSKKIALRYASALAEINLAESIIEELTTVKEVFNNPQMQLFINNPKFDEKLKNQTLDQLFKDKVSTDVLKTLKLLLKKNRLSIAPHLLEAYEKTFYDKKDILIANIASPKELDENQLAELKVELERIYQKTVKFGKFKIKPELLAGLRVTIGDKRIDFSLRSALESMKKELLSR